MKSAGYEQILTYEYTRLAIGYLSVAVAAIVYLEERRLGFNKAFYEIAAGVTIYLLLTGAFYFWVLFVEKRATYIGKKKGVTIRLATKRDYEKYEVTVLQTDASGRLLDTKIIEGKFNEWFDYQGYIVFSKFDIWLKGAIVRGELKKNQ
jgi:signal peptidase complex subunit 2